MSFTEGIKIGVAGVVVYLGVLYLLGGVSAQGSQLNLNYKIRK